MAAARPGKPNPAALLLLCLVLAALPAQITEAKDKAVQDKHPKVYKSDLDADAKNETITIEVIPGSDNHTRISVVSRGNTEAASFTVPGIFDKLELIDLKEDGYKQLAVYSSGKDHYANLAIYGFKNSKLSKIFAAASNCGIDTDFSSVLSRIKVGRQRKIENSYSSTDIPEWDVWVWSGEKFIRE